MIKATNSEGMGVIGDAKTSAKSAESSTRKSLSESSASIQAEQDRRIKKIPRNCINPPTGLILKPSAERGISTITQSYPPFTLYGSPLPSIIQGITGINIKSRKTGADIPGDTVSDVDEDAYLAYQNYENNILTSSTIITDFNGTTLRFKNQTYNLLFISMNAPFWENSSDESVMKYKPDINLLFVSYDEGGNRDFFHICIPVRQNIKESYKNPFLTSWFNKTAVSPSGLTINDLMNFRGHETAVNFNLMEFCLDYNTSGEGLGIKEKYRRRKITSGYNLCVFETPLYADLDKISNILSRAPMPIRVGDRVKLVSTYERPTAFKRCLEDGSDTTGGEVFWVTDSEVKVCANYRDPKYNYYKGTEVINVNDVEQPVLKINKDMILDFNNVFNIFLKDAIPYYTPTSQSIIDYHRFSSERHFGTQTQNSITPAFFTVKTSLLSGTSYTSDQLKDGTRGLKNVKCYPIDLANQIDDAGNIYIDESNNNPEDPKSILRDSQYSQGIEQEYDVDIRYNAAVRKRKRNIAIFIILTVLLAILVFVIAGYLAFNILKPSDLAGPVPPTAPAAAAKVGQMALAAAAAAAVPLAGLGQQPNAPEGNRTRQNSMSPTNAATVGIIAALASSSPT